MSLFLSASICSEEGLGLSAIIGLTLLLLLSDCCYIVEKLFSSAFLPWIRP